MKKYTLTIKGMTPLVMNSNAGLMSGAAAEKSLERDKNKWEQEHYMDLTYRTPDGQLYIPARAIKKGMIVACKFLPDKPKGTNFKSFGPFVEAAMIVEDDGAIDVSADKVIPWTAIVNLDPSKGNKGPRGPRTRALIPMPWHAQTTLAVFDDLLTESILGKIAETAGLKCGFLDARTIDMGRAECRVSSVGSG